MWLKANRNIKQKEPTLYIMRFWFDEEDAVVYKIGVTQRGAGQSAVLDRMQEIHRSIFKNCRYFPRADIKRFRKTDDVFKKEAMLHRYFNKCKYTHLNKFDGYDECFIGIDEDDLLSTYERVLRGDNLDEEVPYSVDKETEGSDA